MKTFKMTAAAAAVAAATLVGAPAQAAIQLDGLPLGSKAFQPAAPGQGELFVSIVARGSESAENRSYIRDLGITANTFVQALLGGTLGSLSYSIGPDVALSNFLSTHAGKAISFNLTAVNNPAGYDPATFDTFETGYLSTSGESFDATAAKMPKDISQAPVANLKSFVEAANLATDGSPTGDPAQNFSLLRAPGDFGFHDNNWGGAATFGFNTEGEMGGMVDFYFLELHNFAPYELHELGQWSLLGDGTLEFTPVPLPAAAWMLGSGIIGLAGLSRRRRETV
ncbi:MAG: VPLPA-CTERM sorting domain-containing protein [Gammaproteobacteria bacterium]